jgi:hypothetical protein
MGLLDRLTKTKFPPKRCPSCGRINQPKERLLGSVFGPSIKDYWQYLRWNSQFETAEFECP